MTDDLRRAVARIALVQELKANEKLAYRIATLLNSERREQARYAGNICLNAVGYWQDYGVAGERYGYTFSTSSLDRNERYLYMALACALIESGDDFCDASHDDPEWPGDYKEDEI